MQIAQEGNGPVLDVGPQALGTPQKPVALNPGSAPQTLWTQKQNLPQGSGTQVYQCRGTRQIKCDNSVTTCCILDGAVQSGQRTSQYAKSTGQQGTPYQPVNAYVATCPPGSFITSINTQTKQIQCLATSSSFGPYYNLGPSDSGAYSCKPDEGACAIQWAQISDGTILKSVVTCCKVA